MSTLTDLTYRCVSYPAFEPDQAWLRQMLLFADEVYRIIPRHNTKDDSDELKRLIELTDGAVKTCDPYAFVDIEPAQAKLFGKALDQPSLLRVAESKKRIIEIGVLGSVEVKDWEFLHVEKIGRSVRQELTSRKMLWDSPLHNDWQLVPRGVGNLVVGMLADKIAERRGFDAVTDQPMAFALNGLNQCIGRGGRNLEGVIASAVAKAHVPAEIGLLTTKKYVELRKRHSDVRREYAQMVRELKDIQRMNSSMSAAELRSRVDGIVEHVGVEMGKFKDSKAGSKFHEWVPFVVTSLVPIAATLAFGPLPGAATGLFSFGINAISKASKKTAQFRHPKVLQTLCAVKSATARAAVRKLSV